MKGRKRIFQIKKERVRGLTLEEKRKKKGKCVGMERKRNTAGLWVVKRL